jgi:uncharacterized membrane protein YjjB (DUF3815 family)
MNVSDLILKIVFDALWSGIAALGFAILFNVPRALLPGCVAAGALGHALRLLLMQFGLSIEWGTLVGATVVGLFAKFFADRTNSPSAPFAIVGAIPMVPGVFAYRTMIGILSVATSTNPDMTTTLLVEASANAIKTALLLAALAMGIAAPNLLFKRPKPVT